MTDKKYEYTPDKCPSNHYNDGSDICADCGHPLNGQDQVAWKEDMILINRAAYERLLSAVSASLGAWRDEEDSVQEEHEEDIAELEAAFDAAPSP
jgi:ribosomal protein L37E